MPRSTVLILALTWLLAWQSLAEAQLLTADPYAKDPSSSLTTWPLFYKLPPGHPPHYYYMGWCGNCIRSGDYAIWYEENSRVNVNAFPETSLEGKLAQVGNGFLLAREPDKSALPIVIHNNLNISQVHVHGPGKLDDLRLGMYVRFVAQVDETGGLSEPLDQVVVFTPSDSTPGQVVLAGTRQVIEGKLVRHEGNQWQVRPLMRSKFPAVRVRLTEKAQVVLDVGNYSLAHEGDPITVRGRLYEPNPANPLFQPEGGPEQPVIFACRVEIELPGYVRPPNGPAPARPAAKPVFSESANSPAKP